MTLSTTNQAYIFLATVYVGLLLGLVYDIYRAARIIMNPGKWFVAIMDLSFWILAAFMTFYTLYKVNSGEIRLYAFIGLALGWGLYTLSIGGMVVNLLVKVYRAVTWAILWPIRKVSKAIKWVINKLTKKNNKENKENKNYKI